MDTFINILIPILPTLLLIGGGQIILNRYEERRKSKEQQIELLRFLREQRYQAVEKLYNLFGQLIALYREIDDPDTDLKNQEIRLKLLKRAVDAESEVDALICQIVCEFAKYSELAENRTSSELEALLGHLRQSVLYWRKRLSKGQRLEFYSSDEYGYIRFKETFAMTAALMVQTLQSQLEPAITDQRQAARLLIEIFSNKYENITYESVRGKLS